MTIVTILPSAVDSSRGRRRQQQQKPPWTCRTFRVFLFGTLCVSSSQLLFSIRHTNNTLRAVGQQPPTPVEQLHVSKEIFLQGPQLLPRNNSVPDGLRDFIKQQDYLQRHNITNHPPDLTNRPDYHVVFSTSCSMQQHWESYVFFYHAKKVQQPGNVTRIVSSCSEAEQAREQQFFDDYILPMRDDGSFHIHFTPDYGKIRLAKGTYYKYMNKPFGLRHWMENALGMNPETMQAPSQRVEDAIVFLLDPDFVLLRPIVHDFSDAANHIWVENDPATRVVRHGFPIAQQDGYLTNAWMKLDMQHITNLTEKEAVPKPSRQEGPIHYNSGPPYLATVRDMYQIAVRWTEYAPRVVEIHPELFAEMKGLIYSTLQLKLPFTLIKSLTVSWTKNGRREGWPFIDSLPDDQLCEPPPPARLPISLHYCKEYNAGKWFWSKYRLKENILNCDKSLLEMPPRDLALQNITYHIYPPSNDPASLGQYKEERIAFDRPWQSRREPFMLCHLTRAVNEAVTYHKSKACPEGGNLVQNYTVYNDPSLW